MSGARPDTWMPFYCGDYLRDTMHLSPAEHGGYLLLILHYWTNGGALPDDNARLARIARMGTGEWGAARVTLSEFFTLKDGMWHHKRIDHELMKAKRISKVRQRAGKHGGKASANARANTQANGEAKTRQTDQLKATQSQPQPHTQNPSQEVAEVSDGSSGGGGP